MDNFSHILLVEDDLLEAELIVSGLGYDYLASRIVVARDGAEAMDYLHCRNAFQHRTDGNPALVLLDLNLPKVSGLEVLRDLKGDTRLKDVPVVVLTSSKDPKYVHSAYHWGAQSYIVKPINFEDFIMVIRLIVTYWGVVSRPPDLTPEEAQAWLQL